MFVLGNGESLTLRVLVPNGWVCLTGYRGIYRNLSDLGFRVQVPNKPVLGFGVMVIVAQVRGKVLIIECWDASDDNSMFAALINPQQP